MKRFGLVLLCLGMVLGLAGCAQTQQSQVVPEYVLTYADNQPEGYPTIRGAHKFAQLVEERTGGKVVIQVKSDGEFGSEEDILTQMAFGGVDFARVSLSAVCDELPKLNVLQLPFLYEDSDHMWRILDGEIGAEFLALFPEIGLVGLSWYDAGARSFYSGDWPIDSPEDLEGLTVRVQDSELMMDMVELLGGEAVTFDYGEVYYAFATDRIDVAENNWPTYQLKSHYELARFYTVDEHTRVPEPQLASARTWDALPEEYRQIIAQCARESSEYQREIWVEQEAASREEAIARGCREVVLTQEQRDAFRELIQPLYEKYGGEYADLIQRIREG